MMPAGKFNGISDEQWELLKGLMPEEKEKRGKGMPHAPFRNILNTIFYILITGSRWCDVPVGPQWASRTASHRWLGRWQKEGLFQKILDGLLGVAELAGKIDWKEGAVDGSFSPWQRRRRGGRERV